MAFAGLPLYPRAVTSATIIALSNYICRDFKLGGLLIRPCAAFVASRTIDIEVWVAYQAAVRQSHHGSTH